MKIEAADLQLVLALVRGGTLQAAAERLGVDPSTVFRGLQRAERALGQSLFVRGRHGYAANALGERLAQQGEALEAVLDEAQGLAQARSTALQGRVRISSTDTLLHGLLAPVLATWAPAHPGLEFELQTGNELSNLSRRDADLALRATRRPPQHLIGRELGTLHAALYAGRQAADWDAVMAGRVDWVAPDDALPDHPSVRWRQRHWPRLQPRWRVQSIQSVAELVAQGLGVGVLPMFLAEPRRDLVRLSEALPECATTAWLLAHAALRQQPRLQALMAALAPPLAQALAASAPAATP